MTDINSKIRGLASNDIILDEFTGQQTVDNFEIVMFGKDGQILQEDNGNCIAKMTKNSQYEVFHVKRSSRGFFNPKSDVINRDVAFFKIKKEAFDNYIHFLKTGDQKFLNNAERIV